MNNRHSNRKRFEAFVVKDGGEGRDAFWNRVGSGFQNADGSLSIELHLIPGVWLQIREHVPREEREDRRDRGNSRNNRR